MNKLITCLSPAGGSGAAAHAGRVPTHHGRGAAVEPTETHDPGGCWVYTTEREDVRAFGRDTVLIELGDLNAERLWE